jgi:hypothetical protein
MKYVLLLISVFVFSAAFPQRNEADSLPGTNATSGRELYIRSYPDKFFIWPVLKQRKLDFEMKSLEEGKYTLRYLSNKPYSMGFGMYIFELGFELAFAIPLDEQSKRIYGESHARDLQLNVLGKKWGADLFLQRYNGFYISDKQNPVPTNEPYPQRPDIETKSYGLVVNRIFNSNKFSFRSAYNFIDRQLTSAGSVIVFASLDNFTVGGDSALIGTPYAPAFGESSRLQSLRSTSLGLAPGYTYSLIFKGFFINGALAVGPVNNFQKFHMEDGTEKNDFRLSGFLAARISIGYNGDKFFGGLTFMNQGRNARFENLQISNSQSAFKILFGFRFRESGILTKRALDIPARLFK